ncbi:hypothetical protein OAN96_00005, partial [Candidatus Gracilibacteria bacterium]|nr:hypothetical protein [Candidatus Gracilibacteria bacterium]
MNAFDLNNDDWIDGGEITEEYKKAQQEYISDTGRSLAPIVGIVYATIYFLLLQFVYHTIILPISNKIKTGAL